MVLHWYHWTYACPALRDGFTADPECAALVAIDSMERPAKLCNKA